MIGIIDYGMGNLRSVQKAFEHLGHRAIVLPGPHALADVTRLVLPGVGAFGDGMTQLSERGWVEPIRTLIADGRPFLGICLGMQLLFEASEEAGEQQSGLVEGLSVLPGQVRRLTVDRDPQLRLKVPHMGWNEISWTRQDPLFEGLTPGVHVYFVHAYHVLPIDSTDAPVTSATTDYGITVCASVWRDNVWATQFHPEKSQRVGMVMLDNFAKF